MYRRSWVEEVRGYFFLVDEERKEEFRDLLIS